MRGAGRFASAALTLALACDSHSSPATVQHALRIHLTGTGTGEIRSTSPAFVCAADCVQTVDAGASANLVATAAAGSKFDAWAGDCTGAAGCTVAMAADRDVTAAFSLSTPPPGPVPTLVQHISSSTNPVGLGIPGNNFRFTLPNAVGAGNCLILGMSYAWSSSRTVSIADGNGNPWPTSPAATTTDGGNLISSIFVLPNARAGVTTITVSFNGALLPFQYTTSEFYGVATSSPVNGSSARSTAATVSGTATLSSGSFTPSANNDANGGNLIWSYFANNSDGSSHTVTNFSAAGGFTSLHSDVGWHAQGMPTASEYLVQGAQAAINPGISVTTNGVDTYNAVSVALKGAAAGTAPPPSGIRIVRQNISSLNVFTGLTTWDVQFPSVGNLLVLTTPQASVMPTTSVTDSRGNTWVKYAPDNEDPQIWYVAHATPDPNLKITFHMSSSPSGAQSALLYDIVGADPNPLDAVAEKLNAAVSSTHLTDSPVITPGSVNGLTIAAVTLGQGPISLLDTGAPAGAFFDYVYYTNELDTDLMDNADGRAHLYNTDLSAEHWNWLLAGPTSANNYASTAVHFKSAP